MTNEQRQIETISGIYLGSRGDDFKTHIESILKKGNLRKKYIEILTTRKNMEIYSCAYTSELVDEMNNYQTLEQKGDLTGNKFIVDYIYSRFPQLNCAEGVKVAARLRINYGSKNSFCKIGDSLGCWKFITATNDLRQRKKKPLLEDVFEAFLGATETILDNEYCIGVGYACVYKILKNIFDDMKISLRYEDLYDSKTRLKELFDIYSENLGQLQYEEQKDDLFTISYIYRLDPSKYQTVGKLTAPHRKILIGKGVASLKCDAQQLASEDALNRLEAQGFVKHAPSIYAKFASSEEKKLTTKEDVLRICKTPENIDNLFLTRGKNKYQNKYMSTALVKYCRQRDYEGIKLCLEMGANPNVLDSDGMSPTDILFIGPIRPKLVSKVLNKFLKTEDTLTIHEVIKNVYFKDYCEQDSLFREKLLTKLKIVQDNVVEDNEEDMQEDQE